MTSVGNAERLLTRPEAAKVLRISQRTLWTLTQTGVVPSIRLGNSVRYLPDDLREAIARNRTKTHC